MYSMTEEKAPRDEFDYPNKRVVRTLIQPPVSKFVQVGTSTIAAGSISKGHRHDIEEIFYVLDGIAEIIVDSESVIVEKGACVYVPNNAYHQVINKTEGELRVLFITSPPFTRELFISTHR